MKFTKGLFTDTHPIDQPEGTYRYNLNTLLTQKYGAIINESEGETFIDFDNQGLSNCKIVGHIYGNNGDVFLFVKSGVKNLILRFNKLSFIEPTDPIPDPPLPIDIIETPLLPFWDELLIENVVQSPYGVEFSQMHIFTDDGGEIHLFYMSNTKSTSSEDSNKRGNLKHTKILDTRGQGKRQFPKTLLENVHQVSVEYYNGLFHICTIPLNHATENPLLYYTFNGSVLSPSQKVDDVKVPVRHGAYSSQHPSTFSTRYPIRYIKNKLRILCLDDVEEGSSSPVNYLGSGYLVEYTLESNTWVKTVLSGNLAEYPGPWLGTNFDGRNSNMNYFELNGELYAFIFINNVWYPSRPLIWVYKLNEQKVDIKYGKLYNWFAASNSNIAPEGYRVATDGDWTSLKNYLESLNGIDSSNVGNVLKSCRQIESPSGGDCDTVEHPRWSYHPTIYGTNDFNFSAFPGGSRFASAGSFHDLGNQGHWWTSTSHDDDNGKYRALTAGSGGILGVQSNKKSGYSVKCVRDATEDEEFGCYDGQFLEIAKDIEGNFYQTVKIGDLVWFVENLAVTKYKNGDNIPNILLNDLWKIMDTPGYCDYNNEETNAFYDPKEGWELSGLFSEITEGSEGQQNIFTTNMSYLVIDGKIYFISNNLGGQHNLNLLSYDGESFSDFNTQFPFTLICDDYPTPFTGSVQLNNTLTHLLGINVKFEGDLRFFHGTGSFEDVMSRYSMFTDMNADVPPGPPLGFVPPEHSGSPNCHAAFTVTENRIYTPVTLIRFLTGGLNGPTTKDGYRLSIFRCRFSPQDFQDFDGELLIDSQYTTTPEYSKAKTDSTKNTDTEGSYTILTHDVEKLT